MNPEVKKQWLEALRGGRYTQGVNYLRDEKDSFCCLGVLCDLYTKQNPNAKWVQLKANTYYTLSVQGVDSLYSGYLPEKVYTWAGLDSTNPLAKTVDYDFKEPLTSMNDNGMKFSEIADIIEREL